MKHTDISKKNRKNREEPHTDGPETTLYVLGWICIGVVLAVCLGWMWLTHRYEGFSLPCMFYRITGYYCPGCGGTRAFRAFWQGRIFRSVWLHPVVPYGLSLGGWFMISQTLERMTKGKWKIGLAYRDWYLWVALGLVGFHFLTKNLLLLAGIDCLHP